MDFEFISQDQNNHFEEQIFSQKSVSSNSFPCALHLINQKNLPILYKSLFVTTAHRLMEIQSQTHQFNEKKNHIFEIL